MNTITHDERHPTPILVFKSIVGLSFAALITFLAFGSSIGVTPTFATELVAAGVGGVAGLVLALRA